MTRSSENFYVSTSDQLLTAVEENDLATINRIIGKEPELLRYQYEDFNWKTIVQIAICDFSETVRPETVKRLIDLGADLYFGTDSNDNRRALHYAALSQNPKILRLILNTVKKERLNDVTTSGETALHLLIRDGDVKTPDFHDCLDLLLRSDIDVNKADKGNNTAVVIAVRKKYKDIVVKLVDSKKDVIDLDNYGYKTKPSNEYKTVRRLIEEYKLYDGELPSIKPFKTDLASFIRAKDEDGFLKHANLSTNSFNGDGNSNNNNDSEGTLLQMACERNLKRVVSFLLNKDVNQEVNKTTTNNKKTPLEIAGERGFYEIFEALLPKYRDIPENLLVTLLQNSIYEKTTNSDHKKCLNILLARKDLKVNAPIDEDGHTPLHLAVKYSDFEIIMKLLNRGASLGNRAIDGALPVDDIYPKTLERHLDQCFKTEFNPPCDRQSTVVTMNYKTLFPSDVEFKKHDKNDVESQNLFDDRQAFNLDSRQNSDGYQHVDIYQNYDMYQNSDRCKNSDRCQNSDGFQNSDKCQNCESCPNFDSHNLTAETDVILAMSKNRDLRYLLKHPVISSLIYLKWEKLQTFFNMNFAFYLIFVLSLLVYIFYENTNWVTSILSYVLYATYIVLILREFGEILLAPKTYAKDFENYLELTLIFGTGYIIFATTRQDLLYKQISAITILLSAIELMLLVGQYPWFSTYITVFRTVSWNFFKFMVWFATLIVAFTLGFYKIFHKDDEPSTENDELSTENYETTGNYDTSTRYYGASTANNDTSTTKDDNIDFFSEISLSFIKVIVMLIGELEAGSFDLKSPLNQLFFLSFIFLITIALWNVLNGLAVSDIQAIKADAEIVSTVERINRIVYVENMFLGDTPISKLLHIFLRYFSCSSGNATNDRVVPTWIARKIFLFPYNFPRYQVKMLLYSKGKVINHRTNSKSCKPFDQMYMNSSVVKYMKEIVLREQNAGDKVRLQCHLAEIKKGMQELLEKDYRECKTVISNVLFNINSIETLL